MSSKVCSFLQKCVTEIAKRVIFTENYSSLNKLCPSFSRKTVNFAAK